MSAAISIFMCGDVMTGRGIDQVLPHPSDPAIYEPHLKSAKGYVQIAERRNGPIVRPVDGRYIWGDALTELARRMPDARIVNLETSITTSDDYWKDKGINYRMHPANISCITVAHIDVCSLANNHVLDWGYGGLEETLLTLKKANVWSAGAGLNLAEADQPAILQVTGKGKIIVYGVASASSGVPAEWAAVQDRPGVHLLEDLSDASALKLSKLILERKRQGDVVVLSIHWGSNWGYTISAEERAFAHALIDAGAVDLVHGHSSHHPKTIEVYREKLVIYGCGDFLNDYEGIGGYEEFRGDLGLMYFVRVDAATGKLISLVMTPTRLWRFRVNRASRADAVWLADVLNREGVQFGVRVRLNEDNSLTLQMEEAE